jgi:hypothetical protein
MMRTFSFGLQSHTRQLDLHIMRRSRKTVVMAFAILAVFAGLWMLQSQRNAVRRAEKAANFLARFEQSFNSGTTELITIPQIEAIDRWRMTEYGVGSFQAPGVSEFVITAQVKQDGELKWGRWLYSCNGESLVGIYKFSYSEADRVEALPEFPLPLQQYIQWTEQMVDGIPATAGLSASNISVPSPIRVSEDLIITAVAPAGTICRIGIFPPDALLTVPPPQKIGKDGRAKWTCRLNPKYAGSQLPLKVYCGEPRGTKLLENATQGAQIDILPLAAVQAVRK